MWSRNGQHSDTGSVLNFGNLQFSQRGTYTCRVNISGEIIMKSATIEVYRKYIQSTFKHNIVFNLCCITQQHVIAPAITARIISQPESPNLGQRHSLICRIEGADNLNLSIHYQWTKNNGDRDLLQPTETPFNLFFSALKLSDAGQYNCQVTAHSVCLGENIVINSSYSLSLECKTLKYRHLCIYTHFNNRHK